MISLLSYNPGFSGDFISNLIHDGNNEYYQNNLLSASDTNKYSPTYLFDFVKYKTMDDDKEWDFTEDTKSEIYSAHQNKTMCITSHRFTKISDVSDLVFDKYARIYCIDETTIRMGFCMWFFKSHIKASSPWPGRIEEINELPENQKNDLYNSFHNWKYVAYKKNLLKDGKPDLLHYIKNVWKDYLFGSVSVDNPGYYYINLKHFIYKPNKKEIQKVEEIFNTKIDLDKINDYAKRNASIVNYMGVDLQSSIDSFLECVYEYSKDHIEEQPISIDTMPKIGVGRRWQ